MEEKAGVTAILLSGSDRIGALDFQASANEYIPREVRPAAIEELIEAASRMERGVPLSQGLAEAWNHRTSIGGARPKAQSVDWEPQAHRPGLGSLD